MHHLSLWKPLSRCTVSLLGKKSKKGDNYDSDDEATYSRKSREEKLWEAIKEASEKGSIMKAKKIDMEIIKENMKSESLDYISRPLSKLHVQNDFICESGYAAQQVYTTVQSIPQFDDAYGLFLAIYPKFLNTEMIDQLRFAEYKHLTDPDQLSYAEYKHKSDPSQDGKVCLDYCGFGLFSYAQVLHHRESCGFKLTEITTNLKRHAVYGNLEEGAIEHAIKTRIMDYLNVPRNEYFIIFTVSRGSAFKLLAESYPFHINKQLLTMYDHESQSVNWMVQCATEKGANVNNTLFKWPTLKPCSTDLKKQILKKKGRKEGRAGLFVFPVQSRVTGSKYSYQWMAMAQQNNWHVLLDAGSLEPKDMDSLGLSLFRPDFIITSFYKVFGFDPSGFGCLLIKKTVLNDLHNPSGQADTGIVRIVPEFPKFLNDSVDGYDGRIGISDEIGGSRSEFPVFSGEYTSSQFQSVLLDEIMRCPSFSYDDCTDFGQSPLGSEYSDHTRRIKKLSLEDFTTSSYKDKNLKEDTDLSFYSTFTEIPEEYADYPTKIDHQTVGEIQEESEILEKNSITIENYLRWSGESSLDCYENQTFELGEPSDTRRVNNRETICRYLDHIGMLSLNRTTMRYRYLINWLIISLLQLQFPESEKGDKIPLVHIYGPKIKYERGASVAFNIRDSRNRGMVHPEIVQKLAERDGIFLGVGILNHVQVFGSEDNKSTCITMANDRRTRNIMPFRVEVVTASLGFLSDFKDVYRMFVFVANFLNPSFLEEDRLAFIMEDTEESQAEDGV